MRVKPPLDHPLPSTSTDPRFVEVIIDVADFSKRLREIRVARGLTQARLAELLEISPRVYNRWEKGSAVPRLDTLVQLAEILQVSLDELVGREPLTDEPRLQNPALRKLYKQIDRLGDEDQRAAVILIDSLIKRSEMARVLKR